MKHRSIVPAPQRAIQEPFRHDLICHRAHQLGTTNLRMTIVRRQPAIAATISQSDFGITAPTWAESSTSIRHVFLNRHERRSRGLSSYAAMKEVGSGSAPWGDSLVGRLLGARSLLTSLIQTRHAEAILVAKNKRLALKNDQ